MEIKNGDEMVTVRDVNQGKFVEALAEKLKKMENLKMPEWAKFVKTGSHVERPPQQKDWWYLRAASILRVIYLNGPVGVERLRSYYGGRKNLGHQPHHFRKAGGKIIRYLIQKLEEEGFVKKNEKGKKGRVITPKGQKFLDSVAKELVS